jgi:hypothetical protein
MIRKRYDELKPGDVFKLSDGRTYALVAEVLASGGGFVKVSGFRDADPGNGQWTYRSRYLADREVDVYSIEEVAASTERLAEWGAAHGRDSYTFSGASAA